MAAELQELNTNEHGREKDKQVHSKIIDTYKEMEHASDHVMDRIDAMIEEKHKYRTRP
jgi:Na+/phosphate symporter